MKYRTLGKTGLNVSVIGVGTWQFGGEWGKILPRKKWTASLRKRKNWASISSTRRNATETIFPKASSAIICKKTNREDWIIATKFGHHFVRNFERSRHFDAKDVLKQLDASLKALKTDYIDIYQAHSCTDEEFDNDDLWTMLDKQKQAGKIRHIGISLRKNDFVYQTKRASEVGASVIQVVYNRLDRKPEEEIFPICREQNLGVLAQSAAGERLLERKIQTGSHFCRKRCPLPRRSCKKGRTAETSGRNPQNRSSRRSPDGHMGPGLVPPTPRRHNRHPRLQEPRTSRNERQSSRTHRIT